MKRSEMLEFIRDEIKEIAHQYEDINPTRNYEEFYSTKAAGMLDMLLGLGMQPPTITTLPNSYNRAEGRMGFDANEWEEENESN